MARKRDVGNLKVNFINSNILDHEKGSYSVVITNFFFDQFNQRFAEQILHQIISLIDKDGRLFIVDFIKSSRLMHRFLFWSMYTFFRITAKTGKVQLIDFKTLFECNGLVQTKSEKINSYIVSEVYKINHIKQL